MAAVAAPTSAAKRPGERDDVARFDSAISRSIEKDGRLATSAAMIAANALPPSQYVRIFGGYGLPQRTIGTRQTTTNGAAAATAAAFGRNETRGFRTRSGSSLPLPFDARMRAAPRRRDNIAADSAARKGQTFVSSLEMPRMGIQTQSGRLFSSYESS